MMKFPCTGRTSVSEWIAKEKMVRDAEADGVDTLLSAKMATLQRKHQFEDRDLLEYYDSHLVLPSGERLHNYGKIHHAINGKIHYFDGYFQ